MSIQRFEGFDHFAVLTANPSDLLAKGFAVGPSSTFAYSAGQYDGFSIDLNASTDILTIPYKTAVTESFVGFWLYIAAAPASAVVLLDFHSADTVLANPHLTLKINTNLSVEMFRDGGTSLASSAASTLETLRWQFIEVRALVDNTAGAYEVRVNETSVVSGSGVNTSAAAASDYNVNAVMFTGDSTMLPEIDDFYLVDTTVTPEGQPVTYLGRVTVATLYPDGDGYQNDFTGVGTGSLNYDRVNESPNKNDDTNYVEDSATGSLDAYTMESIPATYAGSSVIAVQTTAAVKKTLPGDKTIRNVIRTDTTNLNGDSQPVTAEYQYTEPLITTYDPSTLIAWTFDGVNSMQVGIELVT